MIVQLGENLYVEVNNIISVAKFGGDKVDPERDYIINVDMGDWTASYGSEWPMSRVVEVMERALNESRA